MIGGVEGCGKNADEDLTRAERGKRGARPENRGVAGWGLDEGFL